MSFFYLGLRVVRYAKVSLEALIILKTILDLRKVSHTNNRNEEKIYNNTHKKRKREKKRNTNDLCGSVLLLALHPWVTIIKEFH